MYCDSLIGYVSTENEALPKLPYRLGDTLTIETPDPAASDLGSYKLGNGEKVFFPWPKKDSALDDEDDGDTRTVTYIAKVTLREGFVIKKLDRKAEHISEIKGKEPVDIILEGASLTITSKATSKGTNLALPSTNHCNFAYVDAAAKREVDFDSVGDMDAWTTNGELHSTSHLNVRRNLA